MIRSVCGVPSWIFEEISLYDRRSDCRIVSSSDIALVKLILIDDRPHLSQKLMLRDGISDKIILEGGLVQNGRRDSLLNKLLNRLDLQKFEHFLGLCLVRSDVSR